MVNKIHNDNDNPVAIVVVIVNVPYNPVPSLDSKCFVEPLIQNWNESLFRLH